MLSNFIDNIIATQVESSFYKKDIFDVIVNQIDLVPESIESSRKNLYTREEVYFSTIAYNIIKHDKIGYPTTFSEVNRYDRKVWSLQYLAWGIYHRLGIYKFVSKQKYDKLEKNMIDKIVGIKSWKLDVIDIKRILSSDKKFIKQNRYMFDGITKYQIYGNDFFLLNVYREI